MKGEIWLRERGREGERESSHVSGWSEVQDSKESKEEEK